MEWLQGQRSAGAVQALFEQAEAGNADLSMSMVNGGEVFYLVHKRLGASQAEAFLKGLESLPLRTIVPDAKGILEAARLKALHPISYADAFAVSTAMREKAALVTGDPELRTLSDLIEIDWIGR